jgi:hypothetical protein
MRACLLDVPDDNAQDIGRANVRGPAVAASPAALTAPYGSYRPHQPKTAVVRDPLDGQGTGEFGGRTVALRQPRNGICRMRVADRVCRSGWDQLTVFMRIPG